MSVPNRRPQIRTDEEEARRFVVDVARLLSEQRIEEVVVLDVRGLNGTWDFFLLGTGSSARQMHAVLDRVREFAKSGGRTPFRVSDSREAKWILADYLDVAIHLFDPAHRTYYDLEGLWGDAPRLDWAAEPVSVNRPGEQARDFDEDG